MPWKKYQLVFKLLSPLHIGYRKVGNLHQTRKYVPGKVLWAALTARLTRMTGKGDSSKGYSDIGKAVANHFRFGYLWPAIFKNNNSTEQSKLEVCYPWSNTDYDYQFLNSYASTALNYDFQSSEEGTLHETEYIAPKTRENQQVYLKGDLWVEETDLPQDLKKWKEALQKIHLGSERNYGWGRVDLISNLQDGIHDSPEIIIKMKKKDKKVHLPAHVFAIVDGKEVNEVVGQVEPLLGWERDNSNSNRVWKLSNPVICYTPGAIVKIDSAFEIDAFGRLKKI